jgi:hypothetical protein
MSERLNHSINRLHYLIEQTHEILHPSAAKKSRCSPAMLSAILSPGFRLILPVILITRRSRRHDTGCDMRRPFAECSWLPITNRIGYGASGNALEDAMSWYRGDRYEYIAEITG